MSDINAQRELIKTLEEIYCNFNYQDQLSPLYYECREHIDTIDTIDTIYPIDYTKSVKSAVIKHDNKSYILYEGYTLKELETFLSNICFTYYNGYGEQELFGNIWLDDGTWLYRYVYDGSEYWSYIEGPPTLPIRPKPK